MIGTGLIFQELLLYVIEDHDYHITSYSTVPKQNDSKCTALDLEELSFNKNDYNESKMPPGDSCLLGHRPLVQQDAVLDFVSMKLT